jgi:aspartate 1-decarboxylase
MTLRIVCKSKIHHAAVTWADLRNIGSIEIAAFSLTDEPIEPRMVAVDCRNRFSRLLGDGEPADLLAPQ